MDLNLIRVFVAVYESRSLTQVATQSYVTQPAISKALTRLRAELGDQLFERSGRRMLPTALARELYPDFRESLSRIDQSIAGLKGFNPADARRTFRIALSELGQTWFLPAIVAAVQEQAPNVCIEVIGLDIAQLPDWLRRGRVDVAITSSAMPAGFRGTTILRGRYAAAFSADHPLAGRRLTLDAYVAASHIVVTGDTGWGRIQAGLDAVGRSITPSLVLPQFAGVRGVVAHSKLVATVPEPVTKGWMADGGLVASPLPFHAEPTSVRMYQRSTTFESAALDWFGRTALNAVREANAM